MPRHRRLPYRRGGRTYVPPIDAFLFTALIQVPEHRWPEAQAEMRWLATLKERGEVTDADVRACREALERLRNEA